MSKLNPLSLSIPFLSFGISLNLPALPDAALSRLEKREVQERLERFYRNPVDPDAMNQRIPRYSLSEQRFLPPSLGPLSETGRSFTSPLEQLAQGKLSDAYGQYRCEQFLSKKAPWLNCKSGFAEQEWAAVEANDRVEDLTHGYIEKSKLVYHLNYVPTSGHVKQTMWSDDYWKTRWGQSSYRYALHPPTHRFRRYDEAIASYSQPQEWVTLLQSFPGKWDEITKRTVVWSPAEKYDLTLGDESFALTRHQKLEGSKYLLKDGDVENWIGLCQGWAAASISVPKPTQAVTVTGARGVPVTWYPNDIQALLTLSFAQGQVYINSIGKMCHAKHPTTYPNGRISEQDCFDTNPSTFHLALGNLIGKQQKSFIIDKSFDYEIWNHPIYSYDLTYFNPLNPKSQSKDWNEVAVDYDSIFKARDRFQLPLTRGVRGPTGVYDDRAIRKVVGVVTSIIVAQEYQPLSIPTPQKDLWFRLNYTYDLELYDYNGFLYPMGGEWHENQHPDFMWVPRSDAMAHSKFDSRPLFYNGVVPEPEVTAFASEASRHGFPLCQVVKELVRQSTGFNNYRCPVASFP